MKYYRIGPPDTLDLPKLSLSELLIESDSGTVTKEIGLDEAGVPIYIYPSSKIDGSFRGVFDVQPVNDLIGDPIEKGHFDDIWEAAEELDRAGKLRRRI